jgi:hypothetical protein
VNIHKSRFSHGPVYCVCLGIWLTGVCWLIFHYFFTQQRAFGATHHPMEHWSLVAHGAFAFASLWLVGFLWGTHIVKRWRLRRHRKTGGTLFAAAFLLIVSGYLLYYLSDEEWRAIAAIAHWIIGLAAPLPFFAHWLIRARK